MNAKEFFTKNKKVIAAVCAVSCVIIIIIIAVAVSKKENMQDVFYLDQIAMKNSDPTYFKYTGRERDILGQSSRDYYLENRAYSNSHVGPQRLESDSAYINQTAYLGMPEQYRPLNWVGQSGNWAEQERPTLQSVESADPYV